jgi:hypothetical protein
MNVDKNTPESTTKESVGPLKGGLFVVDQTNYSNDAW